ncbi:MAG: thioredoxin domain-containing protein [Acidobacteria bacterium]|nr:thioredoxin domain-containing protein [Acidobacteriota bacterium]
MKKLLYFFLLALLVCAPAARAQRRAAGQTAKRPGPASKTTPAAKPTPTPAPAATNSAPVANTTVAATESCGCEDKPLPAVLAIVNGVKITAQDISPQTQQRINELQTQVTEARRREVDLQINSILLDAEAKKRGMSTIKLLEAEVIAKFIHPSEADAQSFFDQNRARIQAQAGRAVEFKDVRDNILAYLSDQRQQDEAKKLAERLRAAAQVKVLVTEVTPPAASAERARLLATVNGQRITSGDVEDSLRPLIYSVQEQVYNLRKQDVELKINDTLLTAEAQKRGVTTNALLEAEVSSKVPQVTEAQAQEFYNQNKERINGEYAQVKGQIIQYLQEQEARKTETAFATRLRNAAQVQSFLNAPQPPAYDISTDDQPTKGNPNASVTVVEFTDYQCPSCAATHPVVERLMGEFGDRVKFVVRDFPLSMHANAFKAAEAAEAAREQGKYWDFIAVLFRNQSALEVEKLKQYATALGLDRAKFDAALDGGKFAEKVQRDLFDGQKVGVNATPSLYVNGRLVPERTYEALKAAIETALKAPAKK